MCDVVRTHPGEFRIAALAVRKNIEGAEALGAEFGAKVYSGESGALRAVEENVADIAFVATVGISGLKPTLAALGKGMDVALATKEVLVAAGSIVVAAATESGRRIIPVDSEHSAIFQCLQGVDAAKSVSRLILTASGGPFLDYPDDLGRVSPEQALAHPRWKMGAKVSVDSATMMNKGFEIIEAHWLFGVPVDKIEVVVHPESVVHSLVEFADGSTLAQLSPPDMRVPIQYALSWPRRIAAERARLDLPSLAALTFRAPDELRFPALRIVRDAFRSGGTRLAALSAADEIAVGRFLSGDIGFADIARLAADTMERVPEIPCDCVDSVLEADAAARSIAADWRPNCR